MKYLLISILTLFLAVGAGTAQDPVRIAPDAYKLEFENEYVRVQRVHYAPRVTIPEHDHTVFATAYVYLNDAGPVVFRHVGLSYGAVTRPAVKAGSFRLYKAVRETHAVENLSDTASEFMRVEFKTEPAPDPNTLRGKFFREDVPAGENFQQVQFENEQVRITRLLCAAGRHCAFTANVAEPALLVALVSAEFKPAQGKALRLQPGQTQWLTAGARVQWDNTGKAAAELLRFDFKTAPMKNIATTTAHAHPHPVDESTEKLKAEATEMLKRGAALEAAGKLPDSIAVHEQALALNPKLVQAHINLISLYGRTGKFEKAAQAYRNALSINPELPPIHYNYGVLLVAQDRYDEAAQAFLRCLQLDPYNADAHYNYAVMIERESRLDEAATHYRKAIENKSGYRRAHFALGRILVNQNKLAEAIAQFQQTLTPEDEETPRNYYALGATFIRTGDKAKGIQYLREALKRATALQQTQLVISLERDLKTLER